MRSLIVFVIALVAFVSVPALAWDGAALWQEATNDFNGGGGVWGTGGKQDFGIACTSCHMRPAGMPTPTVDLKLTFSPALQMVNGAQAYKPGQRYLVTGQMLNETLGKSGCMPGLANNNGFGTAFELASGQRAGKVESDWGQNATSCPPVLPSYVNSYGYTINVTDGGTTTYGNCHAVVSTSLDSQSTRYFFWTAPAAGAGSVTAFWGVVDGNCDMMSMDDDARTGSLTLAEGT